MRKEVFIRLLDGIKEQDPYFQQRPDAAGRLGISALQKCTAAIRMLSYGEATYRVDEYLRLSETTTRQSLQHFTEAVIAKFCKEYMRSPTVEDLEEILRINVEQCFPGEYQGRNGKASTILEAVASQDLWIWHSFLGLPGTGNGLTVLYRSPVFDDLLNGRALTIKYSINGHKYNTPYHLTDGIYPNWSTFVKSLPLPQTPKEMLFAKRQESARKDVERAFGVLQAKFAVLRYLALSWDENMLQKIMSICIILHNMLVEDERDLYSSYADLNQYINETDEGETIVQGSDHAMQYTNDVEEYITNRINLESNSIHKSLREDLMEHIWKKYGQFSMEED